MAYKALYRTYRPQTFEEVAGQQHIVRTLKNALASNKIAHAYLFCGPRGTGKTTMAKLFAKALNCEEGIGKQCNTCSNCVEITEGTHPDVIEIDAASNNGVEQVRSLIEKVNYLPIKGKYKVYIIDEVHMMTTNAFNALLKTIEEPPAHVIFILATTEPHNIIPTILSRCQRYDFTKVSDADIEERMVTILEKEGITYDKAAVRAIISLADGGMRDALSILDQILAYSGNSLNEEDVFTLFGLASVDEKARFIKAIANGDVSFALNKIKAFAEGGIDLQRLTTDILDILKDLLILKKTNDENELLVLNEDDASDLASNISIKRLNEMIGAFLKAQIDYKTVNNIRSMFEVVVLRLCTSQDVETIVEKKFEAPKPAPAPIQKPEVRAEVDEPKEKEEVPEVKPVEAQPVIEQVKEEKEEKEFQEVPSWLVSNESEKQVVETEGDKYQMDDDFIIKCMVLGDREARLELSSKWKSFESQITHPTLGDIIALIRDAKPYVVTKDVIVLQYDFEKLASKANLKSNAKKIADLLGKMIGHEVFVYSLSRSETVRLYTAYSNLRQISQLPKASSIKIDIKEIK